MTSTRRGRWDLQSTVVGSHKGKALVKWLFSDSDPQPGDGHESWWWSRNRMRHLTPSDCTGEPPSPSPALHLTGVLPYVPMGDQPVAG